MRTRFSHYHKPTPELQERLWNEATIVLDANVVLDIYRYPTKTAALYLEHLQHFRQRLWLPHQVAFEFYENRHTVRAAATKAHSDRIKELKDLSQKIGVLREQSPRKSTLDVGTGMSEIQEKLDAVISTLQDELGIIRARTGVNAPDTLLDEIASLFGDNVGPEPSSSELEEMLKSGKERFDKNVPPGYKDADSKPDGEQYGDYVLWRQTMNRAKESDTDVIFATGDTKSDWFLQLPNKDIVGPRPELLKEFSDQTGHQIIFYTDLQFFRQLSQRAPKTANQQDQDDALADVSAVSENRQRNDLWTQLQKGYVSEGRVVWNSQERNDAKVSGHVFNDRGEYPSPVSTRLADLGAAHDRAVAELRYLEGLRDEITRELAEAVASEYSDEKYETIDRLQARLDRTNDSISRVEGRLRALFEERRNALIRSRRGWRLRPWDEIDLHEEDSGIEDD